jgi:hypothetical protein
VAGFRGGRLLRVEQDGLRAWATELPENDAAFTREDLLAHHALVAAIFTHSDAILPARFPTLFDDGGAISDQLRTRREVLGAQLQRVGGCCEFAVTALWIAEDEPAPPVAADTPGRRYLVQRQLAFAGSEQRRARARELAGYLERLVGADLVDVRHSVCPSERVALSSALLVGRAHDGDVQARLVPSERDVRILVNGPWPPYTFAPVGSD